MVCFPLWYRLRTCGELGVYMCTLYTLYTRVHCTHVSWSFYIFHSSLPGRVFHLQAGFIIFFCLQKAQNTKKNKKVKTKKISGWRERYVYFINILQEILFNNLRQCSYSNIIWKRQKKIKRKKNDKIKYKLKVLCFCHVIIIWWIWR